MKIKSYLSFVSASIAAIATLSFASCDNGEGPVTPGGNDGFTGMTVTLSVDNSSISENSVSVRAEVDTANVTYYLDCILKTEYDKIGADSVLMKQVAADIANPDVLAKIYSGNQTVEFTGLESNSNYYVYAFQLDNKGNRGNRLFKALFKTDRHIPLLEAYITPMNIIPIGCITAVSVNDDSPMYWCSQMTTEDFNATLGDGNGNGDLEKIQAYIDEAVEETIDANPSLTVEDCIYSIANNYGDRQIYNLGASPDTDMTIFVVDITAKGVVRYCTTTEYHTRSWDTSLKFEQGYKVYDIDELSSRFSELLPTATVEQQKTLQSFITNFNSNKQNGSDAIVWTSSENNWNEFPGSSFSYLMGICMITNDIQDMNNDLIISNLIMSSVQTGIFTLLEGPTVVSAVSGYSYWLASYCERYEDDTYQNRLGENSHIAQVDIVKGQYDDPSAIELVDIFGEETGESAAKLAPMYLPAR